MSFSLPPPSLGWGPLLFLASGATTLRTSQPFSYSLAWGYTYMYVCPGFELIIYGVSFVLKKPEGLRFIARPLRLAQRPRPMLPRPKTFLTRVCVCVCVSACRRVTHAYLDLATGWQEMLMLIENPRKAGFRCEGGRVGVFNISINVTFESPPRLVLPLTNRALRVSNVCQCPKRTT